MVAGEMTGKQFSTQPQVEEGEMKAKEWNNKYPTNQSIYLTEDDGSTTATQTRSLAWELGSGQSVVKVTGKTGGYSLDRIEAR